MFSRKNIEHGDVSDMFCYTVDALLVIDVLPVELKELFLAFY